jgi:hypothetical protein
MTRDGDKEMTTGQSLFLVFGGELKDVQGVAFRDPSRIDVVGVYPEKESALAVWKAKAHSSVDNAHMRYFVVDLHKLLQCEA